MTEQSKLCMCCSKMLRGRVDKKFCDDYCRNNYNNARKPSRINEQIRIINNALLKNRRILESLMSNCEQSAKSSRDRLQLLGFSFTYFTHTMRSSKGNIYFYCYEYGYLPMENNRVLLIKQRD
jgi:hypothetical protein